MRRAAGFTLLELMMAIALFGVVALLVYGAARAGVDTEGRLATNHRRLQSARAMRTLLQDALRNARPAVRPGPPAFTLEPRLTALGEPADRLSFVAAGASPPLTSDADWLVTVEPTPAGLALTAKPLGVRAPTRAAALLPGITGLKIRVQAPGTVSGWSSTWPFLYIMPQAVELTYWTDSGPADLPLRVVLPLGAGS